MPLTSEMFADALASAKVEEVVDETKEKQPEGQVEIVIDSPKGENKEPITTTDEEDFQSEDEFINFFKTQIGFEGDIEGSGITALVNAANSRIKQFEEIANDPDVLAYLEHRKLGGTRETFEEAKPSNIYSQIELDEENTQLTQNVVEEVLIKLRNYDDDEEIDEFVNNLKDQGKLFEFASKNLPKLVQFEKANNEKRKQIVEERLAQQKAESDQYFNSISTAFSQNRLIGVQPDKSWSEVQKLSVPDSKGVLGIRNILDNLTPEQVATMNYFAYNLVKGNSFEFRPKGRTSQPEKPIHQVIGKGKTGEVADTKTLGSTLSRLLK